MKIILPLLLLQSTSLVCAAKMSVQQLGTENLINPIGIHAAQPRFSWELASNKRNALQTAYEKINTLQVLSPSSILKSGKISSDSSVTIGYKGFPQQSSTSYYLMIRIWDNGDFSFSKKLQSAMAFINAHGKNDANINSKKIGEIFFTPGQSIYSKDCNIKLIMQLA